ISVEKNDSIADGITANKVKVRVTDANNNPVKGILINATASNGAIPGEIAETDINGETILTLTNKTVGESLVTATLGSSSSQIIITFTSPIDIANSAAVWNKTKILNSSGFDEDGKAIINIKLRDKDNNPVTGIAGDIKPTSSDNKLIISDITETTPGQYAATVTSADIGKHHITVTFAYLNDSIQTPDLDVYTYTFRLDDPNHKIGVTALYEYHLYAKASDGSGSETELDVNLANWTSSNPGIAKIIPPATIQGVREGTTEIRVNSSGKTGYKGIAITADPVTLTVTGLRFSQTFGDSTSKPGSASEYLIAPPDYTLSAHGAWVVDSIGNSGGTGGQTTMITNTNTVTSISVVTCEFENVNVIGKLVFKKPLGNQSIGEANSTCKNKSTFEYVIKTGEQFIGFTGWDSQTAALNKVYLSGIKFITIEK
uniref:Ig-like domain-containing protein n=1 Tax=Morganella psychrotolerans TaxID=368603 RepID=UPI0039B03073